MSTNAVCRRAGRVQTVTAAHPHIADGNASAAVARCASNRHVIGGGGRLTGSIASGNLAASRPLDGRDRGVVPDDGWKVVGFNSGGAPKRLVAYALCVRRG
jgi:hypothetical protein